MKRTDVAFATQSKTKAGKSTANALSRIMSRASPILCSELPLMASYVLENTAKESFLHGSQSIVPIQSGHYVMFLFFLVPSLKIGASTSGVLVPNLGGVIAKKATVLHRIGRGGYSAHPQ